MRVSTVLFETPGGIRGGKQDPVFEGGNVYLSKACPRLDYIIRATLRQGIAQPLSIGDSEIIRARS